MFAPTYQPELNSIEHWFSWFKREVKKARLQDMVKKRRRQYAEIVPEVLKRVNKD